MAAEIVFETDGEDFRESRVGEVMRVLKEVEQALMRGQESGQLYDSEGEYIGHWSVTLPL